MSKEIGKLFRKIGEKQYKQALENLKWINTNGGEAWNEGSQIYLKKCPICGTKPHEKIILARKVRCDFCGRFYGLDVNLNKESKKYFQKNKKGYFLDKKTNSEVFVVWDNQQNKYEIIKSCDEKSFYFYFKEYVTKQEFKERYKKITTEED